MQCSTRGLPKSFTYFSLFMFRYDRTGSEYLDSIIVGITQFFPGTVAIYTFNPVMVTVPISIKVYIFSIMTQWSFP